MWFGIYHHIVTAGGVLLKDSRVVECVQRSGEVLFVPTNWYHGLLNLETSVGIAVEIGANNQLFEALLSSS